MTPQACPERSGRDQRPGYSAIRAGGNLLNVAAPAVYVARSKANGPGQLVSFGQELTNYRRQLANVRGSEVKVRQQLVHSRRELA